MTDENQIPPADRARRSQRDDGHGMSGAGSASTTVYLCSYGLSLLGGGVASVLMPLLVLERTGDVLAAGVLATVTTATSALAGTLGGPVVDRVDRRIVSATSATATALTLAALPVVDAVWGLDLGWFLALGMLGAVLRVPGMTAHEALLPAMAGLGGHRREALDRLIGIRETLSNALLLAGPGLGGLLVALVGLTPVLLLVISATGLLAAGLTLAIDPRAGAVRASDAPPDGRGPLRHAVDELAAGWRFLGRSRIVLGATGVSAVFVAVIATLQTTLMPAYFAAQDLPSLTGLTLSALAAGSIVGSTVYATTVGRVRRRTWFVVGMLGSLVGFAALGTLASPWVVLGAAVLVGLTNAPAGAVLGVLSVEATPDAMRGRVLGAQNALMLGAPALVAAPLGAVAATAGLPVAAAVLAALVALTAAVALVAPVFRGLDGDPGGGDAPRVPPLEGVTRTIAGS